MVYPGEADIPDGGRRSEADPAPKARGVLFFSNVCMTDQMLEFHLNDLAVKIQ